MSTCGVNVRTLTIATRLLTDNLLVNVTTVTMLQIRFMQNARSGKKIYHVVFDLPILEPECLK